MLTQLCRILLHNQPRPHKTAPNRGQIIVIFAVTLLTLLFFAGLAIDSGSIYVTYGQMRRAIDAAAVAAANDYKSEGVGFVAPPLPRMTKAALEVMKLHNLDETNMDLKVYVCDQDGDRLRDPTLAIAEPEFFAQCPDTTTDSARKLVWIDATQKAPLYFLSLMGFESIPLKAHAIAEAAPIDLVIVIDTSESMASETAGYLSGNFTPGCNTTNTCEPLQSAKTAAKDLINTLYDGYDHVAIVRYDVTAQPLASTTMRDSLADARTDVDALKVHDDPPITKIWDSWYYIHKAADLSDDLRGFNPVYPEDRDGNGSDNDPGIPCTSDPVTGRWDPSIDPFGLEPSGGTPCDDQTKFDAYDWDSDGVYTNADDTAARAWLLSQGCDLVNDPGACKPLWTYFTPNSTCTGCGIRVGAEVLKRDGRPNAVWVMVFLSDGLVNLSDTPLTNTNIPAAFPNGYCNGGIGSFMWGNYCSDTRKDEDLTPRYCLKSDPATCPPGSTSALADSKLYSVYDYALDMIDFAALQRSTNAQELSRAGSDIAIYAIGLGDAGDTPPPPATGPIGEYLLRYMAAVGDDGDRTTDPCVDAMGNHTAARTNCGQYYYAPSGSGLRAIFNEISTRIYSRLTK